MEIKFAEVGGGEGFAPIEEGRYNIECTDAKLGTSQSGNPKIDCTFTVHGDDRYKNRKVWHTFSLMQQALFNLKNFLSAGDSDLVNGTADSAEVAKAMVGVTCSAFIQPAKTNTGKDTQKLSNWTKTTADDTADSAGVFS